MEENLAALSTVLVTPEQHNIAHRGIISGVVPILSYLCLLLLNYALQTTDKRLESRNVAKIFVTRGCSRHFVLLFPSIASLFSFFLTRNIRLACRISGLGRIAGLVPPKEEKELSYVISLISER